MAVACTTRDRTFQMRLNHVIRPEEWRQIYWTIVLIDTFISAAEKSKLTLRASSTSRTMYGFFHVAIFQRASRVVFKDCRETLEEMWHRLDLSSHCPGCACETELPSYLNQVGDRVSLHFLHHLPPVRLHCDLADAEFVADLLIQHAGDY